jgi:succinate dehydrogenase flavin-adding protein (antitoxin of CptAB toxin-antitoxin module)
MKTVREQNEHELKKALKEKDNLMELVIEEKEKLEKDKEKLLQQIQKYKTNKDYNFNS